MLHVYTSFIILVISVPQCSWSQGGRNYRPTPTREPPSRDIPGQGVIIGKEIMIYRSKCLAFLGIPFAEPPIDQLRFAPPSTPPKPWNGMRKADKFAAACMQVPEQFQDQDRLLLRLSPEIDIDEDCLYLNIFLPDGAPPSDGWPIMVWFHPGNFSVGAASLWDGSAMAMGQKLIVVTASYRLNIFGFLSTMTHHAPGNAGLFDQVAALDWVREKIAVFGGNPRSIAIAGHSAGGVSVGLHLLSPQSQGKYIRALMMSSKGVIRRSIRSPRQMTEAIEYLSDKFGCDKSPVSQFLNCLRRQPPQHLLTHTAPILSFFGPVVDGLASNVRRPFLPDDPLELIISQAYARVPLMIGYTDMEEVLNLLEKNDNAHRGVTWDDYNEAITETVIEDLEYLVSNDTCLENYGTALMMDTTIFYYTPRPLTYDATILRERLVSLLTEKHYGSEAYLLASAMGQVNTPSYMYRFDYKLKTDNFIRFPQNEMHSPAWVNAPHQFDLPLAWGMPYWTNLMKNVTWNSADKKMTDTILALWGNFIKFGNPTQAGVNLRWDVFRENTSGVMILDRNSNMSDVNSFDYKAFEFWNGYYPKVFNVLMQSCNMTNVAASGLICLSIPRVILFVVTVQLSLIYCSR